MCRWVVGPQLDECAAVEIAFERNPGPSLAPSAGFLVKRDQPIAFNGVWFGNQVGIGRTGSLYDPNPCQKSELAALSLSEPSGPISK